MQIGQTKNYQKLRSFFSLVRSNFLSLDESEEDFTSFLLITSLQMDSFDTLATRVGCFYIYFWCCFCRCRFLNSSSACKKCTFFPVGDTFAYWNLPVCTFPRERRGSSSFLLRASTWYGVPCILFITASLIVSSHLKQSNWHRVPYCNIEPSLNVHHNVLWQIL